MPIIQVIGGGCPGGCGRKIPVQKFLCNFCSAATPDAQIVAIGKAFDAGDTATVTADLAVVTTALSVPPPPVLS